MQRFVSAASNVQWLFRAQSSKMQGVQGFRSPRCERARGPRPERSLSITVNSTFWSRLHCMRDHCFFRFSTFQNRVISSYPCYQCQNYMMHCSTSFIGKDLTHCILWHRRTYGLGFLWWALSLACGGRTIWSYLGMLRLLLLFFFLEAQQSNVLYKHNMVVGSGYRWFPPVAFTEEDLTFAN